MTVDTSGACLSLGLLIKGGHLAVSEVPVFDGLSRQKRKIRRNRDMLRQNGANSQMMKSSWFWPAATGLIGLILGLGGKFAIGSVYHKVEAIKLIETFTVCRVVAGITPGDEL